MATTTNLDSLVINYLTQAQYDEAAQAGTLNANQLYLTPDTGGPTGTLSSVGVSNATNGGLTISGSPLTSNGTITIGHSNVLSSAQTTQAVYPIKIDKNGHISEYGSAVTISDTKVTQNYSTASGGHPILMTPEANISSTSSRGDTTAILTNAIYATPSTGNLQATTFNGYTLAAASAKAVDTSISAASTSTNLPTSAAVASFVEGKGYITSDSDQKLVTNQSQNTNTQYYPIFGENSTIASTKLYNSNFRVQYYNSVLTLQLGQKSSSPTQGKLVLVSNQANVSTTLLTNATSDRTYTLPDKTGTVALTSDIPTVPTNISAFTNDSGYITSADVPEGASAYTGTISAVGTTASNGTNNGFARGDHVHNITSATIISALGYTPYNSTNPNGYTSNTGTVTGMTTTAGAHTAGAQTVSSGVITTNIPTKTSHLTNDSGFITSDSDEKLKIAAVTSGTTYYPIVATNSTTAANRQYDATGIAYKGTNGTANGTNGEALLTLGNSTASTSANWKAGKIFLYSSSAYGGTLAVTTITSSNKTWTLPNATGTIALTSDIPSVPTSAASATTGITASTTANKTTVGSSSTDYGVTAAGSGSFTSGTFSGGSGSFSATVTSHVLSFSHTHTAATHGADSHTHTAPTLGSKVPTVSTASATVSITDPGHTHTLS